jgi:hypothetical protein
MLLFEFWVIVVVEFTDFFQNFLDFLFGVFNCVGVEVVVDEF